LFGVLEHICFGERYGIQVYKKNLGLKRELCLQFRLAQAKPRNNQRNTSTNQQPAPNIQSIVIHRQLKTNSI
jgi:hypothetical protein